ncbi:MAG: iron-containing alcohol dehydrogenase [Proteobacteria bacterium]|nr:iron-containing alcohol dehydrogenase [Pseudomonadota bacterium]
MTYWFNDPVMKSRMPMSVGTSMKALASSFKCPEIFMGPRVLPRAIRTFAYRCPKKRCFIVADEFSIRFAKRFVEALEEAGFAVETWGKTQPEVPTDNVYEAAEAMSRFEPDVIFALGGGSAMDLAKVAWILYERPDITDIKAFSPRTVLNLRRKAFMVSIPTTSGTGSECTSYAVVHDIEEHRKLPISGPELYPDYAILLPELTLTMPPKLTAGTGLDVLAHAIDSIVCSDGNEITDALGLSAIEMTFKWLPKVFRYGKDHEARSKMALASSMAGLAFGQGGVALTHAFGHTIGTLYNIHHGLAVGFFIPYVFQFYKPITDKWLAIVKTLELHGPTKDDSFDNLIVKVKTLLTDLEVPLELKGLGISKDRFEEDMDKLVLFTLEDANYYATPRPMTQEQCEKLFRYAYEGKDVDF